MPKKNTSRKHSSQPSQRNLRIQRSYRSRRHANGGSQAPAGNASSVPQPRFAVAIMAAGKGTRLKSRHPKVLHAIGGKPLLAHVIAAATALVPAKDIFVIVGHEAERVRQAMASTGVNFVLQK